MNRFRSVAQVLGIALLIFGAKLWLIDVAGSDLPLIDQWDGEGEKVIRPWLQGQLTADSILSGHNEHRIITTKLYALGLFRLNGQWNALVETTLNALIHTVCALVLLNLSRRWVEDRRQWVVGLIVILLFALPFSWENTLYGFQVQFYFLLLFSIGHIAFSIGERRCSRRWLVGQLCGVLAIGTMASGFLSSVAVLTGLGWRALRERRVTRCDIVSAAICIVVAAAGWLMKANVPEHAPLHAGNPAQFLASFLQLVAWPGPVLLPVVIAPAVVFVARLLRQPHADRPTDPLLLGLLAWSCLQCAALAYARGGGGVLSSRYFDLLSVNLVLGCVFLLSEFGGKTRGWLTAVWVAVVAAGLIHVSRLQWTESIAAHTNLRVEQQSHVRNYLRSGDPAEFDGLGWPNIPYPSRQVLVQRLNSPAIQNAMPPSVRRPVPISGVENSAPALAVPAALRNGIISPAFSTWSPDDSAAKTSWRSNTNSDAALPILRFRVAGDLGTKHPRLRLVVKSSHGAVPVVPETEAGERWKTVNIVRPHGEWWIEASDDDPAGWFAFTAPVEVSRWSWFAEKTAKSHTAILVVGGLFLVMGVDFFGSGRAAITRIRRVRGAQMSIVAVVLGAAAWWYWAELNGRHHGIVPLCSTLNAGHAIGESEWSRDGTDVIGLPAQMDQLDRRVSRVGSDAFVGEHMSAWYEAGAQTTLMVTGYPTLPGNLLELEAREQSGRTSMIRYTGANPGETWVAWRVALPAETTAVRIRAIDGSTSWGGWLGFTEPFNARWWQTAEPASILLTFATIGISLLLVLGPGLIWRAHSGGSTIAILWPGPLWLCVGGMLCWALGGAVAPSQIAGLWVAFTLCAILFFVWQRRIWTTWSGIDRRVIGLVVVCVMGASAKAAFSGGPPGELYAGRISRTLEVGDRPDSRISYHTVQLIAHHLSPHEPAGIKFFAPWDFSGRGPLAGLAAAPIVLALGGKPPGNLPDQPWSPFDEQGFAAYRIVMISLAAISLLAVFGVAAKVATADRAWIAVALVALTPFFWHELYFSWPKLLAAACVLASFTALLDRKAVRCGLWVGAGFLCHPLALMTVPFLGLWLILSGPPALTKRCVQAAALGTTLLAVIVLWHHLNGWNPGQGGFLQYARAADGAYNVTAGQWWSSRVTSLANTLVPFFVFFAHADHPAFNAVGSRSSPLVQWFFQYWTALPFAAGLITTAVLLLPLCRGLRRHPRVAAIALIGPGLLFTLYWGIATTGLMREGGHVIFLTGWVFLVWAGADWIPAWALGGPLAALRAIEVFALMFAPALFTGTWGSVWLLNDLVWLALSAACLAAAAMIASRRPASLSSIPDVSLNGRLAGSRGA